MLKQKNNPRQHYNSKQFQTELNHPDIAFFKTVISR